MKLFLIFLLQLINGPITHASQWEKYEDDPYKPFSSSNNSYESMKISWKYSNNVVASCNAELTKRGLAKVSPQAIGCAMWSDDTCLIVTRTRTTMHTLGHEIRHCFQGEWHH